MKPMKRSFVSVAVGLLFIGAVGCGSSSDTDSDPDAITSQELAEGAGTDGVDGVEPAADIDGNETVDSLEEPPPTDGTSEEALSTCHKATGYRSGSRFTICVTSVEGHWLEVHTAASYERLKAAARREGITLHIVSGFRTMTQQRYLYRLYREGRGNLAAVPGYSNHQSGHAIDFNTSDRGVYSFLEREGHSYGWRRTVPSEIWHWEKW
jgi:LAS superfamily LD-carboxypeptidase LdcB